MSSQFAILRSLLLGRSGECVPDAECVAVHMRHLIGSSLEVLVLAKYEPHVGQ